MHIFLEPVVDNQLGSRITILLEEDATVGKLHDTVENTWFSLEEGDQTTCLESAGSTRSRFFWLVFRGKCLQDDSLSLSSIGLMDGDVVRVVRRKDSSVACLEGKSRGSLTEDSLEQVFSSDNHSETTTEELSDMSCRETRPIIREIHPNMGLSCGGSKVQIVGNHFRHGLRVRFGRIVVGCTTYSDTVLTCVTPSHAPGVVSVQVDVSGLGHFMDDNCLFTYVDFSVFHNIFAVAAQNSNPVRVPNESCKEMNEEQLTNRRR
ncbi:hypothetical protein GpartN1_g4640.t1 [Galdieria partita]|uniref:Ubiquitin-like domain-containing protein n=1 Tax=Galdieria partita TaxID=83374 RepID=A0A9C7URC2_9RHOD|nr:hypothetical protein GpartN1_g4640.t1 [Galdieria partita]